MKSHNKGEISWLFSQIALLIATIVFISAIAHFITSDEWGERARYELVANSLAEEIMWMDLTSCNAMKKYWPPPGDYKISISSEHISITAGNTIVRKYLLVKPFVGTWKNTTEFYHFLEKKWGHSGSIEDPIPYEEYEAVKKFLQRIYENMSRERRINPLEIKPYKPILMEKINIYFTSQNDIKKVGVILINEGDNVYRK